MYIIYHFFNGGRPKCWGSNASIESNTARAPGLCSLFMYLLGNQMTFIWALFAATTPSGASSKTRIVLGLGFDGNLDPQTLYIFGEGLRASTSGSEFPRTIWLNFLKNCVWFWVLSLKASSFEVLATATDMLFSVKLFISFSIPEKIRMIQSW